MTKTVQQIGEPGDKAGQAQHTPGPWRYVDDATAATKEMGLEQFCIETADGQFAVAELVNSEADARLIAAVPELLAALEAILQDADDISFQTPHLGKDYWDKARAARAKAV